MISAQTEIRNLDACCKALEQHMGNRDPSSPYRVRHQRNYLQASQDRSCWPHCWSAWPSVGLTRPFHASAASIVPSEASTWIRSFRFLLTVAFSSATAAASPGLELWTTDRYTAQKYRACYATVFTSWQPHSTPGEFLRAAWSGTATVSQIPGPKFLFFTQGIVHQDLYDSIHFYFPKLACTYVQQIINVLLDYWIIPQPLHPNLKYSDSNILHEVHLYIEYKRFFTFEPNIS